MRERVIKDRCFFKTLYKIQFWSYEKKMPVFWRELDLKIWKINIKKISGFFFTSKYFFSRFQNLKVFIWANALRTGPRWSFPLWYRTFQKSDLEKIPGLGETKIQNQKSTKPEWSGTPDVNIVWKRQLRARVDILGVRSAIQTVQPRLVSDVKYVTKTSIRGLRVVFFQKCWFVVAKLKLWNLVEISRCQ